MKHRLLCTLLVLASLICSSAKAPAWGQNNWMKHNNNPVLDAGPPNAWDGGRIFYHHVLFDGTQYRMWFSGFNPTLNSPVQIGYATSPDGITWTKYANNPVLRPTESWEGTDLYEPVVIFDGTRFLMWYGGNSVPLTKTGYATSPDGINWTKFGNPVMESGNSGSWDDAGVFPTTVRFEGTAFRMWYTGFDGSTFRFGYATSADGIHWTKHAGNPIMNVGPSGAWDGGSIFLPNVILYNNVYHMWYGGYNANGVGRVGHATSEDGIKWTKDLANPVLDRGASGTWESREAGHPRVLFEGKKFQMWYIGVDATFGIRIGYASADVTTTVAVRESGREATKYALHNNYPNPFNPSTTIRYTLPKAQFVTLKIFNLAGQEVVILVNRQQDAAEHSIQWQAENLPSGVYMYRLQAGEFSETKKMILMR